MSAYPGSMGGRADGARPRQWLVEWNRQIDRFVGASAGEVRAVAESLRRTLGAERWELALGVLRARGRREGRTTSAEVEREMRLQARSFGLDRTIEEWPRHTIGPPSIRV